MNRFERERKLAREVHWAFACGTMAGVIIGSVVCTTFFMTFL